MIDQGVLTAFDLATGNARWRLPSIGIMGLFFDEAGMIYLNTTTASPESLKYSNQIDISRKDSYLVMKLEPKTGKVLWTADVGGLVSYVSGKFIYCVRSYHADDDEESATYTMDSISGRESVLSIKRLNPKNGRVMWEHVQKRAPIDVEFDQNTSGWCLSTRCRCSGSSRSSKDQARECRPPTIGLAWVPGLLEGKVVHREPPMRSPQRFLR